MVVKVLPPQIVGLSCTSTTGYIRFGSAISKIHYSEGPLFEKSTILANPKADLNPNLNLNVSTVVHLHNGLLE